MRRERSALERRKYIDDIPQNQPLRRILDFSGCRIKELMEKIALYRIACLKGGNASSRFRPESWTTQPRNDGRDIGHPMSTPNGKDRTPRSSRKCCRCEERQQATRDGEFSLEQLVRSLARDVAEFKEEVRRGGGLPP